MISRFIFVVLVLIIPAFVIAADVSSTNYKILTPTISTGNYATSTSFSVLGVLSQPFASSEYRTTSTSFSSIIGFPAFPFASSPVVSATAGSASVSLSWTASAGYLGWTPSSYSTGVGTSAGGPYTFTNRGNVLSASVTGLSNGTTYRFVVRVNDAYGNTIATSTEVSATPVAASTPSTPVVGGGGGGGPISVPTLPTTGGATVVLSGKAYPGSAVTILKDAQVVATTNADSNANFLVTVSNIPTGNYIFSAYGEDAAGNRSSLVTFPIGITTSSTATIGGIFLAPTIDVDKAQVKIGDNIAIFGQSAPSSSVTIAVHSSNPVFAKTDADAHGAYLYNLDTAALELGDHTAQSKAAVGNEISAFGASVGFVVGTQNIAKEKKKTARRTDLNTDGKVNLVDFSILAYWYKRPLSGNGLKADMNGDGKVDLVDLSILAANWTG